MRTWNSVRFVMRRERPFESRNSAPLGARPDADGRRLVAAGEGRWHPPQPEAAFTYLELAVDDLRYNVRSPADVVGATPRTLADASR